MPLVTETIQVDGIRCERCVLRLGAALEGLDGLEATNANLLGQVTLSWDNRRLERATLLDKLGQAGFRPKPSE